MWGWRNVTAGSRRIFSERIPFEYRPTMKLSDFDYELPRELIAQAPPRRRDESRLLVLDRATGELRETRFSNFPRFLQEGDLLVEVVRLPSATLEDSMVMTTRVENVLKQFPEVRTVFSKTGRPEIANDVMGVHQTDVWVMLHPVGQWPARKTRDELIEEMSAQLTAHVPGVAFGFTQPIEMRVDELVAGVKADVAVLLYGDDLATLARLGKDIERVLRKIDGAVDVKADYQANVPTLTISPRPEQLASYGLKAAEVMHAVTALGGYPAGRVLEGRARFPLIVRFPQSWREDVELLKQIPVQVVGGAPLTLGAVADIRLEETPPGIEHEAGRAAVSIAGESEAEGLGRPLETMLDLEQVSVVAALEIDKGVEPRVDVARPA